MKGPGKKYCQCPTEFNLQKTKFTLAILNYLEVSLLYPNLLHKIKKVAIFVQIT